MDFLNDPIGFIAQWLRSLMEGLGLAPDFVTFVLVALGAALMGTIALLFMLFTIWLERRVIGRMQDRMGPNRVGPEGLLQTLADMIKLATKEDITPIGADKVVYNFAPILVVISAVTAWAVLPFAINIYGADISVAVLYVVAVGSLGTLAIMLAGWASNNKYALLGAFRTVAQLVCYEVPMILSLLVPVILAGSMSMKDIVVAQQNVWFLFSAPIAALIFFISSVAETGRAPFDLLEAESEIVAGFNIEYSGMKFGMFMVAEFLHSFTVGALTAALFLGGWQVPLVPNSAIAPWALPWVGAIAFVAKSFFGYGLIILARATLPRIRIDHMLDMNWKFLVPLSVGSIIITMVVMKINAALNLGAWGGAAVLFVVNIAVLWAALSWANTQAGQVRRKTEAALKATVDLHAHDEVHAAAH